MVITAIVGRGTVMERRAESHDVCMVMMMVMIKKVGIM